MNQEHQCPHCLVYHSGDYALCDYCCDLDPDEYDDDYDYVEDDKNYDAGRDGH